MVIVEKLKMFGVNYQTNGSSEVKFDDVTGKGIDLPEAIINAAYYLILKFYSQFDIISTIKSKTEFRKVH